MRTYCLRPIGLGVLNGKENKDYCVCHCGLYVGAAVGIQSPSLLTAAIAASSTNSCSAGFLFSGLNVYAQHV